MKYLFNRRFLGFGIMLFISLLAITACDRTSSPEGRMSIKIEELQKAMIDSLKQQNKSILDSLGEIRKEIDELKQARK